MCLPEHAKQLEGQGLTEKTDLAEERRKKKKMDKGLKQLVVVTKSEIQWRSEGQLNNYETQEIRWRAEYGIRGRGHLLLRNLKIRREFEGQMIMKFGLGMKE